MWITRLHKLLTAPVSPKSSPQRLFWLTLSLTFAVIYSIPALQKAFSSEYVVQDDARQHVFWMGRFLDAGLFPNDLIADYFQSVAPAGYTALYQLMAAAGIEPLLLSKLLPLVLGLITTAYCFGICLQLLPVPLAGFIGALLLNQNLWMQDGLVSATPKAFIYPLFLAFLYYLLRRLLIPCLIAIALLGLFYPSLIFICAGILILQLCHFQQGRLGLSKNRNDYLFCATGLGVAFLVLLPYALGSSEFGPTITVAEARTLPEFTPEGRSSFFYDRDPWKFWFNASRSGIRLPVALMPQLVYAGLVLPLLLRYPSPFPLAKKVSSGIRLFPQLILASLAMFFAAHALLFKLHLPSRYTQHSLRIVMVFAASLAVTILLDALFSWAEPKPIKQIDTIKLKTRRSREVGFLQETRFLGVRLIYAHLLKRPNPQGNKTTVLPSFNLAQFLALGATVLLGLTLIIYPASWDNLPWTGYIQGRMPALYEFFQQQPKDSLIASLSDEVNNLPTFSQRSILVGSEYAIPYHLGYYRPFRQRTLDLIQAQYSPDLAQVQNFIQKYGIDFWMLEQVALTPEYIANNPWLNQYQPAKDALAKFPQGTIPALSTVMKRCAVFEREGLVVLEADCILKTPNVQ